MHAATVRTFDLSVSIKPEAATRTKSFLFRYAAQLANIHNVCAPLVIALDCEEFHWIHSHTE